MGATSLAKLEKDIDGITQKMLLEQLKELIDSKPALDQGRLNALLAVLESVEKSDEPVKKGILVGFSDLLNKYSDLVVPIGKILLDIFAGIH